MTEPVQDTSKLEGESVGDQEGRRIGKIEALYVGRDGGDPAWVTLEASIGLFSHRKVFVPLARLKEENGNLLVPYSKRHILDAPDVDPEAELSAEDERLLRDHYGIDRADGEVRSQNEDSYAARVSDDADGAIREDAQKE